MKLTKESNRQLQDFLIRARSIDATDLILVVGSPPTARVDGRLLPLADESELDATQLAGLAAALLPEDRLEEVPVEGSLDFSFTIPGQGRFRCNLHRERGYPAAAIRLLPPEPPALDSLGLPDSLADLTRQRHGLVLVTGPTGSGKTTTLAALLRGVLENRRCHVITIEDPVEYTHTSAGSIVEHIEIGRDAASFAEALRSSLRQDPDVLLVGEMRDQDSIAIAVTAAETGHLVLSTLHTGDATQTLSRIVDAYPPGQQEVVRTQLSISLTAVVSQVLLPRPDGPGRIPAVEIMIATDAVRALIRSGRFERLRSQLSMDRSLGSLPLDVSLADLVLRGMIAPREARLRAREPGEFDRRLAGGRSAS